MHESALIFVAAATFGQIIPKCDRYGRRNCQVEFEIVRIWIALWIYFRMLCEPPRAGLANVLWRLDFSKMKLAALLPGFLLKESRALAKLVGPALQVQKSEAGGGVICWGQKNMSDSGSRLIRSRQAAPAANVSWNNAFRPGNRDYFGERMLAWVLMSCLCFSTTRRSSPSIVLNASWMTFFSGS
jgi:hypothetical protein